MADDDEMENPARIGRANIDAVVSNAPVVVDQVQSLEPCLPQLASDDRERIDDYVRGASGGATLRAYKSDWRLFLARCQESGYRPLPATSATVAAFLTLLAERGFSPQEPRRTKRGKVLPRKAPAPFGRPTIGRRLAAIVFAHRAADVEPPNSQPNAARLERAKRGIRKKKRGELPGKKGHADDNVRRDMVRAIGDLFTIRTGPSCSYIVEPMDPTFKRCVAAQHPSAKPPSRGHTRGGRCMKTVIALAALVLGMPVLAQDLSPMPIMGFYVPWDQASLASLKAHGEQLTWVVPGWIFVSGPDHKITDETDTAVRDAILALRNKPKLLPMVQNAFGERWFGPDTTRLLHDPKSRANLLDKMITVLAAEKADGMFVDLENLPDTAQSDLRTFLAEARTRFGKRGWEIAIAAPVANDAWDLKALSAVVDHVLLMAYDEHYQGGEPGPIASTPWFRNVVRAALKQVPSDKAVIGIASYAYDWEDNGPTRSLSISAAKALAASHGTKPILDAVSDNMHFSYTERGKTHQVWMMTKFAIAAQVKVAKAAGAKSLGLWRLGTEDAATWPALQLPTIPTRGGS